MTKEATSEEIAEQKSRAIFDNIPKGLNLSRLSLPLNLGNEIVTSEVLLVGVKRRTQIHASYVYDFLNAMKPESVFVQMPPDLPMFIKADSKGLGGYRQRWFSMVTGRKESNFLINTHPEFTSDIMLNNKDRL